MSPTTAGSRTCRTLLRAGLFALLLAIGSAVPAGAVCGNAIVEGGEECDPGGGTFIQGNPDNAACVSGGMCFFRHSCCKFNCQFVGNGPTCDDGNDCTGNGQCTMAEDNCTGALPLSSGTACGSGASTLCTAPDTCNGVGGCLANHAAAGTTCGDPTDNQCNAPDTCNGSGTCLSHFAPAGTPAGTFCDDGGGCTSDECDGGGGCTHVPVSEGEVCRGLAGSCDVAEVCTGGVCPPDVFLSSATGCRGAAGVCDTAENCTGSDAACPADAFLSSATECRGSAGVCDAAENCTGSDAACPADAFLSSATECRGSAGVCDAAENCTGSDAACPADAFLSSATECRGAAGVCDVAESCTGSDAACPADAFLSSATECRGAAGVCDAAESCTGSDAACPADTFLPSATECRGAAGVCDVAESCTGAGSACPADELLAVGVECRAAAGPCDTAEACLGTDPACPADAKSTDECRATTGPCDPAESCDGLADTCPADAVSPGGTSCDDEDPCTGTAVCDGAAASCPTGTPVVCGACEACDGVGGCVIAPLGVCREITGKKARFILKDRTPDDRDTLVWKFNKLLDTTETADFGTPTDPVEAGYHFCVFQDLDPDPLVMNPELIGHIPLPAGPPWAPAGAGFKLKQLTATPKGLLKVALKAVEGVGKVNLKARGSAVPPPIVPLGTPVVVHFQSEAACWQASYSAPKVNQAGTFKGLADD